MAELGLYRQNLMVVHPEPGIDIHSSGHICVENN